MEAIAGVVCMITLLVVAAAIPVVNLLTLGFLLEVEGRVARTGRFRDALPLLPAARRLGVATMWVVLLLVPIRWLGIAANDAWLISPGSGRSWLWIVGLVAAAFLAAVHLLLAIANGAGFWAFLRPINNLRLLRTRLMQADFWATTAAVLTEFVAALQLALHARLAAFVYAGVYLWVAIPTFMFTVVADSPGTWERLLTIGGGICLIPALMWLPFLLAHCVAERRFVALFEIGKVCVMFRNAPFTFTMASIAPYAAAFVLLFYCAKWKAELPPHETIWDVMLIFLITAYPARVLLGWAYHRAQTGRRTWLVWRCANLALLGIAIGVYVLLLYMVETSGLLGRQAVWQHHALLLPFPWPQA
jgi:hypothetical protein